jgi:hypothetical protein
MQFSDASFDPEIMVIMRSACDEAWRTLSATTFFPCLVYEQELRGVQALRVTAAVRGGERDPQRLKAIALEAIAA